MPRSSSRSARQPTVSSKAKGQPITASAVRWRGLSRPSGETNGRSLTVCTPLENIAGVAHVTVSMPHLVGGQGILATLEPGFNPEEQGALHRSALLIRNLIDQLEGSISPR